MSEHPPDDTHDRREPEDSPQRRLVETVQAYEVDPPPPARAAREDPQERSGTSPEE